MNAALGVTTSQEARAEVVALARRYSQQYGLPYQDRRRQALADLAKQSSLAVWLVFTAEGPFLYTAGRKYTFHLNMAELRIQEWEKSRRDYLADILREADCRHFLDATFGIGSDSMVVAYTLGDQAKVTALESSLPLFLLGEYGLRHFVHPYNPAITEALRKIRLLHTEALTYLQAQPANSVDVVYFDFMFAQPVKQSGNLTVLRRFAVQDTLSAELWEAAQKAAKKMIIVKDRSFGQWFGVHPPDRKIGGKYSRIAYGVWRYE